MTQKVLQVWFENDPGGLLEALETGTPLEALPLRDCWASHYPESFIKACKDNKIRALNSCYTHWKELDPASCEQALKETDRKSYWGDSLTENTKRDNPEHLIKVLVDLTDEMEKVPGDDLVSNQTKGGPRRELREAWAELNPSEYIRLCKSDPEYLMREDADLWSQIDAETFIKTCRTYPSMASMRGNVQAALFEVSPEYLEELIEWWDKRSVNKNGNGPTMYTAKLLMDWDKYKHEIPMAERLQVNPKRQIEDSLSKVVKFLMDDDKSWVLEPKDVQGIVKAAEELGTATHLKILQTLAMSRQWARISFEDLETWRTANPTMWAEYGQRILENQVTHLRLSQGRSPYIDVLLAHLLGLLEYYKAQSDDVAKWLKDPSSEDVETWLSLTPYLLDEAQREELTMSLLETPKQNIHKTMWAVNNASNLKTSKPVRLQKGKPKGPSSEGVER
jgi:dsDNA-binding SOS-regulon protein